MWAVAAAQQSRLLAFLQSNVESIGRDVVVVGCAHEHWQQLWSSCSASQDLSLSQDEAFELWTQEWGKLYEIGSRSYKIIQDIIDTWYLVSVVENDYVHGDLFQVLLGNVSHDDQVDDVAAAWNPDSQQQDPKTAAATQNPQKAAAAAQ